MYRKKENVKKQRSNTVASYSVLEPDNTYTNEEFKHRNLLEG